jgi:hypothetical protein
VRVRRRASSMLMSSRSGSPSSANPNPNRFMVPARGLAWVFPGDPPPTRTARR